MSECGYKCHNLKAKLFAETWHMEMISRDIEQKEQDLKNLNLAKEKCEEEIVKLQELIDKGVIRDDESIQ